MPACISAFTFCITVVQTISLIKFKLSIIITVEIFYAFYMYDKSYDGPLLSYGLERFICSQSDDGDNVLFSVRLSVVSQLLRVCSVGCYHTAV